MTSTDSKKLLSRHLSIGPKPPAAQSSETSLGMTASPAANKYADKDRSTFLRRRQTVNSIDSLDQKFGEGSFPSPSLSPLPAKREDSSGSFDADEKEKKANEEKKPRLFVMEKWLYHGSEGKSDEGSDGEKVEGAEEFGPPTVVEKRRLVETIQINATHREVIRRTWPIIADQMHSNGCQIFLRIFELSPGIKRVFGFGPAMSGVEIASHPRLVQHASRFMEAMQVVVEHLEELDTVVSPVFINLGKRHIYFKDINAEHFNVFSGAILFTWRQALGARFSAEVRSAWSRLFDFVIQHLRFGYELELGDNESRSSQGQEKTDTFNRR